METSQERTERRDEQLEKGFTLIELLIAIVVVGILTAVAIVGIASLTNNGRVAACNASRDAAAAAYAVQYANTSGATATDLATLVSGGYLRLTGGTTAVANVMTGTGWTLTRTAGPPVTYLCA